MIKNIMRVSNKPEGITVSPDFDFLEFPYCSYLIPCERELQQMSNLKQFQVLLSTGRESRQSFCFLLEMQLLMAFSLLENHSHMTICVHH